MRKAGTTKRVAVALCLLVGMAIHFAAGLHMMRPPKIESGDGVDYLNTAYHLRHRFTFTSEPRTGPAPPEIGREPVYPAVLAAWMAVDPASGDYRPGCAEAAVPCDPGRFRAVSVLNLLLIELAALSSFGLAAGLTGDAAVGLAAAGYVLLNVSLLRSHWYDPMSDSLALALVSGTMLAFWWAWDGDKPWRWALAGLLFAALVLTKAVFLPFGVGVALLATGRSLLGASPPRRAWRTTAVALGVAAVLVGGWAVRNWQVSGMLRLTDARGGIALSTREVFDHMTAPQFAAAFVYWSPGGGEALAKRIFAPETVAPFDLYAAGGFYDRGQNGYGRRVEAAMRSDGLDLWAARAAVDRAVVGDILAAPLGYAASTLPLLYRGLWFDQFAILALPWLAVLLWRSARAGAGLLALLLGFGLYNELAYALFSLNIQRYQITAIPSLALAASLGVRALIRRGVPIVPRPSRRGTTLPRATGDAG